MVRVIVLFLLLLGTAGSMYSQSSVHPKLERWYQKELYNRSCPLRGDYTAGTGDKMQMYYYQNVEGKADYIQWMGAKTWLEMEQVNYNLNDVGSGEVTITCKIGQSTSNGGEPQSFSSNRLKVTYHLSGYRTTAISLDGKLYMSTGMHNNWKGRYRRK
jgi:hypothetical protein